MKFGGFGVWIGFDCVFALLGMHLFHHKTRKKKFTIGVPLMLAAQILLLFFLAKAGLLFFT